jgi:2-hydroxychromene-2-carboxylate isomerase
MAGGTRTSKPVALVIGAMGSHMYWGQDRLDFIKEALEQQA